MTDTATVPPPSEPPPRHSPHRSKPHKRFLRKYLGSATARLVAVLAFLATVIGLIDWGWSVYQNTFPEISARDSEADSSFLLPFIIQNKSSAFDMTEVRLTCGVGWFMLQNEQGQTMGLMASLNSGELQTTIAAGHPANFPCDVSPMIQFEKNGTNFFGMHTDLVVAPMKISSMITSVTMKYKNARY
jgi:hypothetical protein